MYKICTKGYRTARVKQGTVRNNSTHIKEQAAMVQYSKRAAKIKYETVVCRLVQVQCIYAKLHRSSLSYA